MTDRDIVNFLRPREDWSKGAVLEKLRITESRYARCVAELRAVTPVDRTCVLRFLRAGNRLRRKKDAMARFHITSEFDSLGLGVGLVVSVGVGSACMSSQCLHL